MSQPSLSSPRAPTARRRRRLVAPVVAVLAIALGAAACAPPGSPGSGGTGDMVQAVNSDRAFWGMGGLAWDSQLYYLAQSHANELAASGSLWHSNLGSIIALPQMAGWRSLGENLAVGNMGMNAFQLEDMWMASPPHRANILNGGFNRIGVGMAFGGGRVWMVALFGTR